MSRRNLSILAAVGVVSISVGLIALFVLPHRGGRTGGVARQGDVYYRIGLDRLKISGGTVQLPLAGGGAGVRVGLDTPGEAYVRTDVNPPVLLIRAPAGRDVRGRLYLPRADGAGLTPAQFVVRDDEADPAARLPFLESRLAHYRSLAGRDIPGQAWFRRQAWQTARELGQAQTRPADLPLDRTFALLGAGRHVAESLALDAPLPNAGTVRVDSITSPNLDVRWKRPAAAGSPRPDALARLIPADQHAFFFPSFDALVLVIGEAQRQIPGILGIAGPRAEDGQTIEQYERQLCLPINRLSRMVGPRVIESVAITGSDPSSPTGTDLAVLFESRDPGALKNLLLAQATLTRQSVPQCTSDSGNIDGISYTATRSPDRSICSYLLVVDSAVVVSNSLPQLQRIVRIVAGRAVALSSSEEYRFLRERYPAGGLAESAFLVVPRGAIDRWASARWRIADSRRTRAAGELLNLQAENLETLVRHPPAKAIDLGIRPALGRVRLTSTGAYSDVYGSPSFLTPALELDIASATADEVAAYEQWRRRYERAEAQLLGPMAIRLSVQPSRLAFDATLLGAQAQVQYANWLGLISGGKITTAGTDPHPAVAQGALAIDRQAQILRDVPGLGDVLKQDFGVDLLGWMGQCVSVYADDDPFWDELAQSPSPRQFVERNIGRVPVGVHVEVASSWRLRLALAAARALADAKAGDAVMLRDRRHNGHVYTQVIPSLALLEKHRLPRGASLYYAAVEDALVLSPSEQVIGRAIDRASSRGNGLRSPWLGSSCAVRFDRRLIDVASALGARQYSAAMQQRAWDNIPIQNEWRRLYGDHDPLKLHGGVWDSRLLCPGGGQYVWNEQWQTMESTAYGHPAVPKPGPRVPPLLANWLNASAGVDLEGDAVRVRLTLDRKQP